MNAVQLLLCLPHPLLPQGQMWEHCMLSSHPDPSHLREVRAWLLQPLHPSLPKLLSAPTSPPALPPDVLLLPEDVPQLPWQRETGRPKSLLDLSNHHSGVTIALVHLQKSSQGLPYQLLPLLPTGGYLASQAEVEQATGIAGSSATTPSVQINNSNEFKIATCIASLRWQEPVPAPASTAPPQPPSPQGELLQGQPQPGRPAPPSP